MNIFKKLFSSKIVTKDYIGDILTGEVISQGVVVAPLYKAKVEISVEDSLKSDMIEIFTAKLMKNIVNLKLGIIKTRLSEFSDEAANAVGAVSLSTDELFSLKYNKQDDVPNSTQQSVPTWIVFGMFSLVYVDG